VRVSTLCRETPDARRNALTVTHAEVVVDGETEFPRHQAQATGSEVSERNWMLGW
jgi:hypothetical protein